jgi:predicted TIM-barrel fold metal-dependent hydrolase
VQFRRIATEEAWAIPEQFDAWRDLIKKSTTYDPDLFLARAQTDGGQLSQRLLDVDDERLRIMDEARIDVHLLALTSTGVQALETELAVSIATLGNDRLAEAIARHPDRYAGLATIAPQDPKHAVKEMERAIRALKLNGVMINSHTNGEYLDESKYWPILEAAAGLGVPIYIHPRSPSPAMAQPYRKYHLEHAIWGYAVETGLHAVRLIVSGVFDAYPTLKIVIGHMGENIPYALYRMDWMHARAAVAMDRPKLKLTPSEYFKRNFMITTSGVNWHAPLKFCIEVLGADNIMWAVDYPYQETHEAVRFMNEAPIPDEQKAKIFHRNAERVFRIPPAASR